VYHTIVASRVAMNFRTLRGTLAALALQVREASVEHIAARATLVIGGWTTVHHFFPTVRHISLVLMLQALLSWSADFLKGS
jgi:hypothetical protein